MAEEIIIFVKLKNRPKVLATRAFDLQDNNKFVVFDRARKDDKFEKYFIPVEQIEYIVEAPEKNISDNETPKEG